MTRLRAVAALALAAALAPPAAAAKEPRFVLKAKAAKEKVRLGEKIPIELTLQSRWSKAVAASPLRIGTPTGLVFDLKTEKGLFQVSRLFGKYEGDTFKPDVIDREQVKPGGSLTATVNLLALLPGKMEITAVYLGLDAKDSPDPIAAKPVTVTVEPGEGGETKVGARIRTSKGTMTAALFPEKAYNTVHNFLWLAQDAFYNRKIFHRIMKGFMVQTGDPKADGTGGPGYFLPAEFNDTKHEKGVLSMARQSNHVNTAGSQFFIVHETTKHLDGQYTAFGRVTEGLEVVDALATVPVRKAPGTNPAEGPSDPVEKPTLDGVDLLLLK